MIPSKIPVSFERLLELRDIPPQHPYIQVIQAGSAAAGEPLHNSIPLYVMRKIPQNSPPTCEMIPKLPVLALVDGNPSGHVYENACGKILIYADEQPDGSVLLKTIPEIHFGGETRKITSEGGVFTPIVYKSKLQFDQLAVETKLLLGQWVVIGPETRQKTGFGRDILSQGDGDPELILIAIRLRQTSKDGIHGRNDIAVLRITEDGTNPGTMDSVRKNESLFSPNLADQELGKTM
jgi:hypothetical protein